MKKKSYIGDEIRVELATAFFHGYPLSSGLCGKVYKKEFLINSGKYLNNIKFFGDDLFYNLEIFLKIRKIDMINMPLYYYRTGGNTSKFMPYLFNDMVNGYNIQKEIIEEYYQDSRQIRFNGISVMLLNTFKTCLYNINLSNLSKKEKESIIESYSKNQYLLEAIKDECVIEYFDEEYLKAIHESNSEYLFKLGSYMYEKTKLKRVIMKFLS